MLFPEAFLNCDTASIAGMTDEPGRMLSPATRCALHAGSLPGLDEVMAQSC